MKVFTILASVAALAPHVQGFGDNPGQGSFDICGSTCESFDEVIMAGDIPCDATWEQICSSHSVEYPFPPEGFNGESMLYELCPEGASAAECSSFLSCDGCHATFFATGCTVEALPEYCFSCDEPDFTLCPGADKIRKERCGCEATGDLAGTDFCNYDDGGGGTCEACENFQTPDDCHNDGLPAPGAADCEVRCFSGPCGCEDGTNFCNYDDGGGGTCEACEIFQTPDDCHKGGLPASGAADCEARCFITPEGLPQGI